MGYDLLVRTTGISAALQNQEIVHHITSYHVLDALHEQDNVLINGQLNEYISQNVKVFL